MKHYNSGLHDPYWYESFVGLTYILKMLETDTGIEEVAFQSTMIDKLDDVVIKYTNGRMLCLQVKHTRVEKKLTLSDLIRPTNGAKNSLLQDIAIAWKESLKTMPNCIPMLYTNRQWGTNTSQISNGSVYPPLNTFWKQIKRETKLKMGISDIQLDRAFNVAWNDLLSQLDVLGSDTYKHKFLKKMRLQINQPDLMKLEMQMLKRVGRIFGISSPAIQLDIFNKLVASLRFWTTSINGGVVNPEEVYSRLSLPKMLDVSDHQLSPPVPFFKSRLTFMERLKELLGSADHPIIFLTGSPGSGKSSLISQLADETSNLIDLRYHAFKPITPDMHEIPADSGQAVDARFFWTSLLDQIRNKFFGQLHHYNVPIRSDYLSIIEIRKHTLRLAEDLSNIKHKPTVIVIDGIDHAARAGYITHKQEDTFLHWLVHPNEIPHGVVFLLAGQPSKGYPAYPEWLKEDREDILHLEIPTVTESDIRQMLRSNFSYEFLEPAVKVIQEAAADNTLASVFAVREASNCESVEELVERLKIRKLHDGIHSYYDHIWTHAIHKVQAKVTHKIAYLNEKLSGCFSLSSERLDGATLKGVFVDSSLTEKDWNYLLKDLEPLVIEQEKGKFVLFHNDVRVYFMRYIRTRADILESIAGSLVDFYLTESKYKIARHADLLSLLTLSKRKKEITTIFDTSYIMEAWAARRPMEEIIIQCREMLDVVKEWRNWDDMARVLEAIRTVQLLLRSHNKANEQNYIIEDNSRVPVFVQSEGLVKSTAEWDIDLLKRVLKDSRLLVKHGQYDRAWRVMERWFQRNNITPFLLLHILREYEVFESNFKHDKPCERFLEMICEWGELAGLISIDIWQIQAEDVASSLKEEVASAYSAGFLQGMLNKNGKSIFRYLKKYLPFLKAEKKVAFAEQLLERRRWTELRYFLKSTDPLLLSFHDRILIATYSAIANLETERFVYPIVDQGYSILEHEKMNYKTDMKLYSSVCFLKGWTYPESDMKQNAMEAVQAYYSYERDPRVEEMVLLLLNTISRIGAYYRLSIQRGFKLSKHDINLLISMIEKLYMMDQSLYSHLIGYIQVRSFIMKMVMYLSRNNEALDKILYPIIREGMIVGDIFYLDMDIVWEFLDLHGDRRALDLIFQRWAGDEGIIWNDSLDRGINCVETFTSLGEKYQMKESVKNLKDRIAWKWFAMTARKTVSLEEMVCWIELLLQMRPSMWKHQGLVLIDLCRQLNNESNQVLDHAVCVVMAAAQKDGIGTLWAVLNENGMLNVDNFTKYKVVFDLLIYLLKDINLSERDLLDIWSLTIGGLSWRDRSSRSYIEDMRKCILKAAHRLGYTGFSEHIKRSTPYHFDIHNNRDRDNRPKRWFETGKDHFSLWGNIHKRVERKIKGLSLDEAFDDFQRLVKGLESYGGRITNVEAFYYAEILIRRLREEPSYHFKEYSNILFDFAGIHAKVTNYYRNERYIDDFYSAFIRLQTEDEARWRLLEPLIPDTINDRELSYFIIKMEELLQVRAEEVGFHKIEESVNRFIGTYKLWFNSETDAILPMTCSSVYSANEMSWRQFTLNILIRNLSSHNIYQVEAALQGLWQYIQQENEIIYELILEWETIDEAGQEWMLILFERIAAKYPFCFEAMKPLLIKLNSERELKYQIQAQVVLETFRRRQNVAMENPFSWLGNKLKAITSQFKFGEKRTERYIFEYPLFQDRFLNQRLYQISSIFPEFVEDLFEELEALNDANIDAETRMLQIVEKRIENGTWERTSVYNEVQAYLSCDDPFLLLDMPLAFRRSVGWPKIELTMLSQFDSRKASFQFIKQARKGLQKDQMLLGAALFDFNIVEGHYFTCRLAEISGSDRPAASGRSFLFYNSELGTGNDRCTELFHIFNHVNGQRIPYSSTILLVPSLIFRSIGWCPSISNPLVWEKKGKRVMWMEQIFGPYEELGQPFLQRWVCTVEGYKEIKRIKQNFQYIVTYDPFRVDNPMKNLPNNIHVIR
ncbi:ATP-binding protein [Paenibacillus polymyxa]|uniref:ATP-binding protein n=1 Tax=Paenibacillus polymyxa TaxID=1406 RepID=UPI003D298DF7